MTTLSMRLCRLTAAVVLSLAATAAARADDAALTDAQDAALTDAQDAALTDAQDAALTDAQDAALTDAQKEAVNSLIKQYIDDNPEVIIQSLQALQKRREVAARDAVAKNLETMSDRIMRDPNSPTTGNADGDITLVEFFDYRCGYCKQSLPAVLAALKDDPNLRVVFKEYPILSPESAIAARAALASKAQGKYFEFHTALMSARGSLAEQQIMDIAAEVGLDVQRLKEDMAKPEIQQQIDANYELAGALSIEGTPTFVIGNQILSSGVDVQTLRALINRARAG